MIKLKHISLSLILAVSFLHIATAQGQGKSPRTIREIHLTIRDTIVNITGKETHAMSINGLIPGPTLTFNEGDSAIIYVTNEMEEETSVHWHGLLLPNFQDGVPYLTTPPIHSGQTFMYTFPIIHSGTYWYHSHTMLQEQNGVFGSIVIHPQEKTLDYNKDFVLVLSDWTNEKPLSVLRNLKRGNEWYGNRKGTATPLNQVIQRGALGAQMNFWKQRMEGADIADIYYDAFLSNGMPHREYNDFEPGDKVRVRIINAAASTYFWVTIGGSTPLLVASDGVDIVPVHKSKILISVAETYDFIVTIPPKGKLEIKGTAQDGSGYTTTLLGNGIALRAERVARPDKIGMMMQMSQMNMRMGAPALKFRPKNDEPEKMMKAFGMQMDMDMGAQEQMKSMKPMKKDSAITDAVMKQSKSSDDMSMSAMEESGSDTVKMQMSPVKSSGEEGIMKENKEFGYEDLRSPVSTAYDEDFPIKEILLNLTGNMNRYIWSLNGIPLSETDKIKIKKGEVTRMVLNNLTMMHHPMHLHGHFFRVLNSNGAYSPMKHTVNVPPMQKVTIEFLGDEAGDWFFHCHILYHMMGGMARVFSYDTPRDERLESFPLSTLVKETDAYYTWGMVDLASQMTAINVVSSNIRNQFNFQTEFGYNANFESEVSYERYLSDYTRVFGGINVENENSNSLDTITTTFVAGMRFLTSYLLNLDVRIDNKLRPQIGIGRSMMIFPRLLLFGYYEYQADFRIVKDEGFDNQYRSETVWSVGTEYLLSRNFSLMVNYDNRFGGGGGLTIRF